jgi:GST-like protein
MMLRAAAQFLYSNEKIPYAIDRYTNEINRLFKVANNELSHSQFLSSDQYSIADIATYPWIEVHKKIGIDSLKEWSHLERWMKEIESRAAVQRVYARVKEINPDI